MAFCDECGGEVESTDKACRRCGHALDGGIAEAIEEVRDIAKGRGDDAGPAGRSINVGDERTDIDIGEVHIHRGKEVEDSSPYCRECGTYVTKDVSNRCPRCGVSPLCWRHYNRNKRVCAVCSPEAFESLTTTVQVPPQPSPPEQPTSSTSVTEGPPKPAEEPRPPAPPKRGNLNGFIAALALLAVIAAGVGIFVVASPSGEEPPRVPVGPAPAVAGLSAPSPTLAAPTSEPTATPEPEAVKAPGDADGYA